METAVISYRVADFLKKHAPFYAMEDADLLALAADGRVRFHEPNEYVLWQGEPHRAHIFVIQQGTVTLWNEAGGQADLRDVRGAGDMLGIERFNDAPKCAYSVRSESDVVIYAFPADAFEGLVLKYPLALQYVAAEGRATADYQPTGGRREPQNLFLHDVIGRKPAPTCTVHDTVADAARRLLASGSEAIAVVDAQQRTRAVLTARSFLTWAAQGGGHGAEQSVESLIAGPATAIPPHASVTDTALALGTVDGGALAITLDGTPAGRLQGLITPRDLAPAFGDHPAAILGDAGAATATEALRELNQRARALTLEYLTGAASVDWLTRFTHRVDARIVSRLLVSAGAADVRGCWCFCGSSGRAESLTRLAPHLLLILEDGRDRVAAQQAYQRVLDALMACDYLPRHDLPFETSFYVASIDAWQARYRNWVRDPVLQQTYRARSLFDVRAVHGQRSLWQTLEAAVMEAVDRDFLHVLANDCLASLPPLTFFEDAVVDSVGEQVATFRLEHSALRPLVDVGRVFAMAARQVLGRSTLERFEIARALLPEHEAIFREAADTSRIVLWQQGRVGISQGTRGADLPPALLSRHDRQVLKGGFRSILRLLEFTADRAWLERL